MTFAGIEPTAEDATSCAKTIPPPAATWAAPIVPSLPKPPNTTAIQ